MTYFVREFLQLQKVGVLLLRGLDSRLSKELPSDLQKLRCKVLPINVLLLQTDRQLVKIEVTAGD